MHDRADAVLAHRGEAQGHRACSLLAVEVRKLACPGLGVMSSLPVLRDHHAAENGPADSGHGAARVEAHALDEQLIE